MAFIGNTNTTQAFTPAIDYFSGNGSTTAFTLSRPVASVAQVQVTIDNVAQNPSSAFTVSANTITFTSAPLSGTNNIYVYYTSPITQVIAPGQGTVNTTALGNITNIASGNSSLTLQTGSSNTTAVTVDTSQNVGVGVTPSTWSTGKVVEVSNAGSAIWGGSSLTAITAGYYYNSGDKYAITGSYALQLQINYGAGEYRWYNTTTTGTAGASASVVQAMTLDKNGRLLKPYQPAFRATSSGGTNTTAGNNLIFDTKDFDIGTNYNTANGRFTAPVAGIYLFYVTATYNTGGTSATYKLNFNKNGAQQAVATEWQMNLTGYNTIGNSTITMSLSAGDYVNLYVETGSIHTSGSQTKFGGYLLG
jgi:hypothetical protein